MSYQNNKITPSTWGEKGKEEEEEERKNNDTFSDYLAVCLQSITAVHIYFYLINGCTESEMYMVF